VNQSEDQRGSHIDTDAPDCVSSNGDPVLSGDVLPAESEGRRAGPLRRFVQRVDAIRSSSDRLTQGSVAGGGTHISQGRGRTLHAQGLAQKRRHNGATATPAATSVAGRDTIAGGGCGRGGTAESSAMPNDQAWGTSASPLDTLLMTVLADRFPGVALFFSRFAPRTAERLLESFAARLPNANTRVAYLTSLETFVRWCELNDLCDLTLVRPLHISAYLAHLEAQGRAILTRKLALAALKRFFGVLCELGEMEHNPVASVSGPRLRRTKGITRALSDDEREAFLAVIPTGTLQGLRDRALFLMLFHTFARISAVLRVTREAVERRGARHWVRFLEKGAREHEVPLHHRLDEALFAYLSAAGIETGPVFRPINGPSGRLLPRHLTRGTAFLLAQRYAAKAGIDGNVGCHSFRASAITTYLKKGGTLDQAQKIAGHASPGTTKLYDRTEDAVTIGEIERL